MLKMITLISRKAGMSREAFRDHYENVHVPLSHSLFPEIVKSVRNYPATDNFHYVGSERHPAPPCDVITEHFFANRASYEAMMANFASDPDKFQALSEDEDKFCDKQSMIMFLVDHETSTSDPGM
jgi:hypothetical protein